MKLIKYFFQFLVIIIFFLIFKLIGYKKASTFSGFIVSFFGPFFRSKKLVISNISRALPFKNSDEILMIQNKMWSNYGRILSDYVFMKNFRKNTLNNNLKIEGKEILENIKKDGSPVIFISGHFINFELMAMEIEKSGIKLAAIYRPLNNIFINYIMEFIRKKYICKNQIKKGLTGIRQVLKLFKKDYSIALMIDQRVSEGIKSTFFNKEAFTTTIPAQLVKKFDCKIVPIYIQSVDQFNYKLTVNNPINFEKTETIQSITDKLNIILEKMILKNPEQWIWSHNRWK
ncbi:lysophospholipid acyltransferase family protein [Candidatus Pelagibacter sp.]|jgi:Kdo2-lipid IVA lauroyltransferase/acyltransferase|nr:lysophospholipid acyltransferase family protein [Candidatus Pelagibacter sp.]